MAYITPNTTVHLLQDVRLDASYGDTIYFATEVLQSTYFLSKVKWSFNNQTYQRISEGVIRVEKPEADVMGCSYMMFRNTAYQNKWFYAFVTGTEYVNDITTNIYYEIDEVQTWLFDMTILPCMIERTHIPTLDDVVGASITPENVNVGEYVHANQNVAINLHDNAILIQVADIDPLDISSLGSLLDRVYSGARLWIKKFTDNIITDLQTIRSFLNHFALKPDAILGMYMIPLWCLPSSLAELDGDYIQAGTATPRVVSGGACTGLEDFGYLKGAQTPFVPKNKKLYTYPYNFHEFLTNDGQTMKMRYEYCKNNTPTVHATGTINTPVQVVVRPIDYKGVERQSGIADYIFEDYEEHINITNFPLCSWTNDYFSTWVAQNALPMALGLGLTAKGMYNMSTALSQEAVLSPEGEITQKKIKHFMNLDPNNPKHQKWFSQLPEKKYTDADILSAGLPNITSALQQGYEASIHADQFRGTLNTGNADWSNKSMNVYQRRTHISAEYAQLIDTYFEKYGYNIGKIDYVNRNTRPCWTYVKTQGCKIVGRCPASSVKFVESLYNRGITWWANGDKVGDYSQNNH